MFHRIAPMNPRSGKNESNPLYCYTLLLSWSLYSAAFHHLHLGSTNAFFPVDVLYISVFAPLCCGLRQSHYLCFDFPSNTSGRVRIVTPLFT